MKQNTIVSIVRCKDPLSIIKSFTGRNFYKLEEELKTAGLTTFDIGKIKLISVLDRHELLIKGHEYQDRIMKEPGIKLGSSAFLYFYNNLNRLPGTWKQQDAQRKAWRITFDGAILIEYMTDDRFVLYFHWVGDKWRWDVRSIKLDFHHKYVSAVYVD